MTDKQLLLSKNPQRGIAWVLRTAAITGVLGLWLAVLAGVAVDVRTSWQLARVADQARQFAALPRVTRNELTAYVARRLNEVGYGNRAFELVGDPTSLRIEME